jgi:hypothetical protein
VEHLCRYDRVTLRLWSDGHRHLAAERRAPPRTSPTAPPAAAEPRSPLCLAQAAAHAVLADLRRCATLADLLARYEASAGDLALIRSLVPDAPAPDPVSDPAWRVRDAAFFLRWQELSGGAGTAGAAGTGGEAGGGAGAPRP